jgi:hypothetical protein
MLMCPRKRSQIDDVTGRAMASKPSPESKLLHVTAHEDMELTLGKQKLPVDWPDATQPLRRLAPSVCSYTYNTLWAHWLRNSCFRSSFLKLSKQNSLHICEKQKTDTKTNKKRQLEGSKDHANMKSSRTKENLSLIFPDRKEDIGLMKQE